MISSAGSFAMRSPGTFESPEAAKPRTFARSGVSTACVANSRLSCSRYSGDRRAASITSGLGTRVSFGVSTMKTQSSYDRMLAVNSVTSTMTDTHRKKPEELRSQQWFGRQDRDGFAYRSWVKGKGVPHDQFDGRPVIGICNTFSELTPCNSHFRTLAEQVKIGVYEAGGFPLEFPVMSLGETLLRPTAMLYRNLASMDVEESIRGNPIDGVVLLMGCDKTTPALVMGASSVDLPTIGVSGGPMLNGKWRGQELGAGTGVWSMSEQVRAGTLKLQDFF